MSDGMSDAYRAEQETRDRDAREAADSDYDTAMDRRLSNIVDLIWRYRSERESTLAERGPWGHEYTTAERDRMKESLRAQGKLLASRLRWIATVLDEKL